MLSTPPAIINTLNSHAVRALRSKDVSDRLTNEAAEIVAGTPAQFRATLAADLARCGNSIPRLEKEWLGVENVERVPLEPLL